MNQPPEILIKSETFSPEKQALFDRLWREELAWDRDRTKWGQAFRPEALRDQATFMAYRHYTSQKHAQRMELQRRQAKAT